MLFPLPFLPSLHLTPLWSPRKHTSCRRILSLSGDSFTRDYFTHLFFTWPLPTRREGKRTASTRTSLIFPQRPFWWNLSFCNELLWEKKSTLPFRQSDPVSNDYFSPSEMLRHTSALILGMCGDNLTFSLACHLKDLHFIRETCIINLPY